MSKPIKVRISDIDLEASPQVRESIDQATVDRYAELFRDGVDMDPVMLVHVGPNRYLAFDGHHRIRAAIAAGHESVKANVADGTADDAAWLAPQANVTHGLPLSREGKRRAVLAILAHPRSVGKSDREIAKLTATSHPFVAKLRPIADEESGRLFAPGKVYLAGGSDNDVAEVTDLDEDPASPRNANYCHVKRIIFKCEGDPEEMEEIFTTRGIHRRGITTMLRVMGFKRSREWEVPKSADDMSAEELGEWFCAGRRASQMKITPKSVDELLPQEVELAPDGGNVTTAGAAS